MDGAPFWFLLHRWDSWHNRYLIRDIPVNIALYLPFGFFGLLARAEAHNERLSWRDYAAPVAFAFFLSLAVELAQIYEPSRSSSAVDLLCNTGGAILGVGLAALLRKTGGRISLNVPAIKPVWAWAFLAAVALAFLWPLHFTTVPDTFSFVPFARLIRMDGPTGMILLAKHFCSIAAALILLRASGKNLRAATGIVATTMLVVQCAEIFIPRRSPGITDPLLALIAGYVLGSV